MPDLNNTSHTFGVLLHKATWGPRSMVTGLPSVESAKTAASHLYDGYKAGLGDLMDKPTGTKKASGVCYLVARDDHAVQLEQEGAVQINDPRKLFQCGSF